MIQTSLQNLSETPPPEPEYPSSKYDEEIERAKREIAQLEVEISQCEQRVEKLTSQSEQKAATKSCNYCGQDLSDEAKTRLFGAIEEDLEIETLQLKSKQDQLRSVGILLESSTTCRLAAVRYEEWEKTQDQRDSLTATETELTELATQKEGLEASLVGSRRMAQEAVQRREELDAAKKLNTVQESSLAAWRHEVDKAEAALDQTRTAESPYHSLIAKDTTHLGELSRELAVRDMVLTKLKSEADHYEWVTDAWRRLKNHLFETVLPFLNTRLNEYLSELSDGLAVGNFSFMDTLADGTPTERFHLDIQYLGGFSKFGGLSGGEAKRANVATMLALGDLGALRSLAPIGLRILDEPFDGLSMWGKEAVIRILQDKVLQTAGTVLVMTHDESLKALFPRTIHITKEDGISRLDG
jgi:DNA repair exonuclease SbcCD ATPase subunit